jgi:GTP-binding protein
MKKNRFSKATFIKSALSPETWPLLKNLSGDVMNEVAIVGRSNVGKSSLLNHLFHQKKLARISATPGKTQTLNFFNIDDQFTLVDLPGYGYAKVSKEVKKEWSGSIDAYLKQRAQIRLLLLLIDIRRLPTEEDIAFIRWSAYQNKPLLLIFTKCDKLAPHEKGLNTERCLEMITPLIQVDYCHYSTKDPKARAILIKKIEDSKLWD